MTGVQTCALPILIEILPGAHSNFMVADEDGDRYGGGYSGETFGESKYIILNQKLGNYDLIAEYDLDNFMELKNGLWGKEIKYEFDITIMIALMTVYKIVRVHGVVV